MFFLADHPSLITLQTTWLAGAYFIIHKNFRHTLFGHQGGYSWSAHTAYPKIHSIYFRLLSKYWISLKEWLQSWICGCVWLCVRLYISPSVCTYVSQSIYTCFSLYIYVYTKVGKEILFLLIATMPAITTKLNRSCLLLREKYTGHLIGTPEKNTKPLIETPTIHLTN